MLSAFRMQYRVITALVIREINTRYGRKNIGFLWIIGEPILFVAGVTIAWSAMAPALERGLPMPAIVLSGCVPLTMWRHCSGRAIKAFTSNGVLVFHRQITPFDIITARCLLEIAGVVLAPAVVVLGAFTMVDWLSPNYREILLWSSSVNNVEMIRAGMFGAGAHAHYDLIQ